MEYKEWIGKGEPVFGKCTKLCIVKAGLIVYTVINAMQNDCAGYKAVLRLVLMNRLYLVS